MTIQATRTHADPITTELIRNALRAAANQIRLAVIRSAFSPTIYESQDFSCGVFDAEGRLIGQDDGPPSFLGIMGQSVRAATAASGGPASLEPGDVIMNTWAYEIGSHSQDVTLTIPAFHDGTLVGFVGIKGHVIDLGQKDAAIGVDTTDIWQEGTIFPNVKVYRAGERNEDLWRTFMANSRVPDVLAGDFNSFIGAAKLGVDTLAAIVEKYTLPGYLNAIEVMFDAGERVARDRISAAPDGRYVSRAYVEGFDAANAIEFDVVVEISGDRLVVDFTDAPAQQSTPFNTPVGMTESNARAAVASVIGGGESANEGFTRAIEIKTTPGTIMHATPPAPVALYLFLMDPIEAVYRALSQALPDKVSAPVGAPVQIMFAYGMTADGGFWGSLFSFVGGQGATPTHDGASPLLQVAAGGIRAASVEVLEARAPIVVEHKEIAVDSAGAGTTRGYPGTDYALRALQPLMASILIDGTVHPPGHGFHGGTDGRANSAAIRRGDGSVEPYTKVAGAFLMPGDRIEAHSGGGGGFGSPSGRSRASVLADIEQGVITEASARTLYPQAF
ncbi:hydantoinase B/oxoprolinase family protein [soil metagenome]